MSDLSGRTALVTGASRGIGRALALGLARAGADVALSARDEPLLQAVAAEIEALGRRAVVLPADVTDPQACRDLVAGAVAGLGALDVLVNNAGGSSYMGPFTEMRFSGWEKTMRLNVESIVHLSQAAGAHMVARGRGSVVNVASTAGLGATPLLAAYGASKAAVNALAEGIRSDVWGTGIRVSTILPGYIATDINVGRRGPFTVDLDPGVDALTAAIEREPVRAYVPSWPWRPVAGLLRVLPLPVVRRFT